MTMDQAAWCYMLITYIVGTAALVAAATPNKYDDRLVGLARKVLDVVGANFGFAKNKD